MKDIDSIEDETVEEIIEKYVRAGAIVSKIRERTAKRVKIGESLLEVAREIEEEMIGAGCKPAFPTNISRNEEAAHATPTKDDTRVFGEDIVKIDLGTQIDGYIADTAITIDLAGRSDLVKASEDALDNAIKSLHAGINTKEIAAIIEETITEYGYKPIANLTGHGLARYNQHAPPTIPNVKVEHGTILEEGEIVAIEPFATDGAGRVVEGHTREIYRLIEEKPIRHPIARKLLTQLREYRTLPFAKRWLTGEHIDFALHQLEKAQIIMGYPVLKDAGGGLVSQAEHTVMITENGCEVLTR